MKNILNKLPNHPLSLTYLKKLTILACSAYMGFIIHSVHSQPTNIPPQTPDKYPPQTQVLGITSSTPSANLTQSAPPATPSAVPSPTPTTTPIPEDQQLEAWWSTMEYKNRLDVSITAMEPIQCEFTVTYNQGKSTTRQSIPMQSETCTFETTLKNHNYNLWGKATSIDGKIKQFGSE
jgi:hypothetical protein